MSTGAIPTINFKPFMENDGVIVGEPPTVGQRDVAKKMDEACRLHGFIHLTNFGLSTELRDRAFAASKELFDLPDEVKLNKLQRIDASTNIGYAPMRSESLNSARPPELKEAFNVRFPPAHENCFSGCPAYFKSVVEELQDVLKQAAQRFALACAVALKLPLVDSDFFLKTIKSLDLCTIRFLHAPECDFDDSSSATSTSAAQQDVSKPLRVGEHTDFGAYTFLLLGDHGAEGLQIKPVEGCDLSNDDAGGATLQGWQDVVLPGQNGCGSGSTKETAAGAIINTGALMARWTNDEWKATAHRVIVKTKEMAYRERFSIAFFVDPDQNTIVEVHDKFCANREKRYNPIKSSDYLAAKCAEMQKPKKCSNS